MEFFDFEGASSTHESTLQDDDVASDNIELDEPEEQAANFASLFQDQQSAFSNSPAPEEINVPLGETNLNHECIYTHAKTPSNSFQTRDTVFENVYTHTSSLTEENAGRQTNGKATQSVFYHSCPIDQEPCFQKSGARLPRKAVNILNSWLRDNKEYPYPSEPEKDFLTSHTGLNRTQISNWLSNARRRAKVRSSLAPGAADIANSSVDVSLMAPLERWKCSPLESEPAAIGDITRALANYQFDALPRLTQSDYERLYHPIYESSHTSFEQKRPTPSASSLDTSQSFTSDLPFDSALSHLSPIFPGSMDPKQRRRRRRKLTSTVNSSNRRNTEFVRSFQCTFCTECFSTKHDWERHETSIHLTLNKWTCSPHGGVVEQNSLSICVFCSAANPDRKHLETHNLTNCLERDIQERVFYRKDHLNQHLRLMHHAKFQSCMERWQSSITEIKSRCGFCGSIFQTWQERVDHLADHFKNAASMAQWQGDWGFDSYVQSCVENAIPPYVIEYERRTPNFQTSTQAQKNNTIPMFPKPNSRLFAHLTAYIHAQGAQSIIPSDQMIREEARRIVYGCDDPWNHTCADNFFWLKVLKRYCGLEASEKNDNPGNSNMEPPFAIDGGLQTAQRETKIRSRAVPNAALHSSAAYSPSIQSPAVPGSGFSFVATSRPESLSGNYAGNEAAYLGGSGPPFPTDYVGIIPASDSAPENQPAGSLVQMGFDPALLRGLNTRYSEINPDYSQGLYLDGDEQTHFEGQIWANPYP
ncbi:hypothetical protein N7452_004552 [Penicillium brevicompactum]|uniref:Uncharacterized protein n=1 Tax=Penicillium brevicompactum TaxID=5074 RepID=A0A9W9QJF6_PENBR|nr:hypothetical protein N7452_004552 [Penicillium brevicompactum]